MRRLAAALLLAGAAGQYDPDACESWCARSFPYTCSNAGCTAAWTRRKRPARRRRRQSPPLPPPMAPSDRGGGRMLEAEYWTRGAQIFTNA